MRLHIKIAYSQTQLRWLSDFFVKTAVFSVETYSVCKYCEKNIMCHRGMNNLVLHGQTFFRLWHYWLQYKCLCSLYCKTTSSNILCRIGSRLWATFTHGNLWMAHQSLWPTLQTQLDTERTTTCTGYEMYSDDA